MVSSRTRRIWTTVAWSFAVVATVLNGFVVGYGAVWFQLFGETADAEDYRVSAGGYGAATVVLALAVPALLVHRAPRWLAWLAGSSAAVLGLLAAMSVAESFRAEQDLPATDNAWTGIGGVVWAPWTWALVALGVRGAYRLLTRKSRATTPG